VDRALIFRTSQWEVSGFRRGTGTRGILATQATGGTSIEALTDLPIVGYQDEAVQVRCLGAGLEQPTGRSIQLSATLAMT